LLTTAVIRQESTLKEKLILVTLSKKQIEKAKEINGARKKITHALLCGSLGQMFGTEKQCKKYYFVWNNIFPLVFEKGIETSNYEISYFNSTPGLVNIILEKNDSPKKDILQQPKKGFFAKLFGT